MKMQKEKTVSLNKDNKAIEYKDWKIVRKIDSGSFGTVYEIKRDDLKAYGYGYEFRAALKVINFPESEEELSRIKDTIGKSDESLKKYYTSMVSEIVKEIQMMYKLRGRSNIVSYEDHEVRENDNGVGGQIMIRMELLTSLDTYMKQHEMSRKDIIRLGIHICRALENCQELKIIHRDIKPGNIFVSERGDFKLGDFGIARVIEAHNENLVLSHIGTLHYMAPEVRTGNYEFSVDMYSLGLVMYKLLNKGRLPFLSQSPDEALNFQSPQKALERRFSGEPLPYPCEDDTQLADIVLKACSFHPEDRFNSPKEMRESLEKVLQDEVDPKDDQTTVLPKDNQTTVLPHTGSWDTGKTTDSEKSGSFEKTEKSEALESSEETEKSAVFKNSEKPGNLQSSGIFLVLKKNIKFIFIAAIVIAATAAVAWTIPSPPAPSSDPTNSPAAESTSSNDIRSLIDQQNFISSYKLIQDGTKSGENMDEDIWYFVQACEEKQSNAESEHKRAVAAMKFLSDNVSDNEEHYRKTVEWFYSHGKKDLAQQILTDLREKGSEGEKLADEISLEYDKTN